MSTGWTGKKLCMIIPLLLIVFTASVSCVAEQNNTEKIGVAVTILPQAEFVRAVGGDKVDVTVIIPPGASPHTFEPSPTQMTALAEARLYFQLGSGLGFELAWMDRFISLNEDMQVVNNSQDIELITVEAHEHDEQAEEEYPAGTDPHIWLSPRNAGIMVSQICRELVRIDPENEDYYCENRDNYLERLDVLDKEIRDNFKGVENRQFIVFHPAWGYFARDYGLSEIPVEVEGKEPTIQELTGLIS